MAESPLPPLIQAVCRPALHGNPQGGVRLVETHISWVIVAGDHAYKIKKPVNFGFLDFSTLDLRHRCCEDELRLNRRLAPFLYLGVVAITGEAGDIGFDGPGPVIEYAVKLRRFDESCLADRLLAQNRLTPAQIDRLAQTLADFHGGCARAGPDDTRGSPATLLAAAEHNFGPLLRLCGQLDATAKTDGTGFSRAPGADGEGGGLTALMRLNRLLSWTRAEFQRLEGVFVSRKQDGFVRECHGDLHTGNLVLIGGELIPFDCIEFSEDLRWIDCISEIAFIFMDIAQRGRGDLAWRLINRYMELSGDYAGLEVFDFYRVYRALVRAKVAALSFEQAREPGKRAVWQTQCLHYLDYAGQARKQTQALVLTRGFSGSGKSSVAKALAERLPAIRIASDRERKRLAGLDALERSESALEEGIYSAAMTGQTYALLLKQAERLLRCGFNVILDATYLDAANRLPCRALAGRLGVRFLILDFHAPAAVLSARIAARLRRGGDPSEAGPEVLAMQAARADPLAADEIPFVLTVDTTRQGGLDDILRLILPLTGHGPAHP
jgi:aminoglycoside phosphotransferase family enzyme/predicted kinase